MTWGRGGVAGVGDRLNEGGVFASDLELKPDEKTSGVQGRKGHNWKPFSLPAFSFS